MGVFEFRNTDFFLLKQPPFPYPLMPQHGFTSELQRACETALFEKLDGEQIPAISTIS